MPAIIHPITGCRMDTILGDWLIVGDYLNKFVDMGWAILQKGELQAVQAKSKELADQANEKPYVVENGLAKIGIDGPMTKLDTSLTSLLGGTSTMRVRKALADIRARFEAGEIKGVFIEGNSPGGTVDGTAELAEAIRKTAAIMPVFGHAPDLACSACLWAMTQCTRFTCGPTATVGSLGTRMTLMDSSKAAENSNVKPVVISAGKYKAIGADGKPITEADKAEMQRYIDAMNEVFKGQVASARKLTEIQLNEVATARLFVGKDAVRVGLCDAVCSSDDAFAYAVKAINNPGSVRRDPDPKDKLPVAPKGTRMPLSPSQLEDARKSIPGAANATEADADVVLYNAAKSLHGQLETATSRADTFKNEASRLTTELTELKAKQPARMDPALLRDRCALAFERFSFQLKSGKITSTQFNNVKTMLLDGGSYDPEKNALSEDAKPIEGMFAKVGGTFMYERVLSAFDGNAPTGVLTNVSQHQVAPKSEPGAGGASGAETVTMERVNKLRADAGLPALTRAQFDAYHPESAGK